MTCQLIEEEFNLKDFPFYTITKSGVIRNTLRNVILHPTTDKANGGYKVVALNTYSQDGSKVLQHKLYKVHRLLALQFIENPNNYKIIDHRDRNKENNSLDNLLWCSPKNNSINSKSYGPNIIYQYADTLPEDAQKITEYKNWTFDKYYFSKGVIYNQIDSKHQYKICQQCLVNKNKNNVVVNLCDSQNKRRAIKYSALLEMFGFKSEATK